MKLNLKNIFLILILLSAKSYAVCQDISGKEYVCSSVFTTEEQENTSCSCPCEKSECEDSKVELELLPTKSIEPSEESSFSSYSKIFLLLNRDLFRTEHKIRLRHGTSDGLDPTPSLRSVALTGVVILQ
jgi:hypothetical protein